MGERTKPLPHQHKDTIAAFDREREEAHELSRRSEEIIGKSRRETRIVEHRRNDHDR
jgi:hypothetical protein